MSAILATALLLAGGPFGKFDERPPEVDTESAVTIFDVERCLIDIPRYPAAQVYRQPDRPDQVQLLWLSDMKTIGRVDLQKSAKGTHVRGWNVIDRMRECFK